MHHPPRAPRSSDDGHASGAAREAVGGDDRRGRIAGADGRVGALGGDARHRLRLHRALRHQRALRRRLDDGARTHGERARSPGVALVAEQRAPCAAAAPHLPRAATRQRRRLPHRHDPQRRPLRRARRSHDRHGAAAARSHLAGGSLLPARAPPPRALEQHVLGVADPVRELHGAHAGAAGGDRSSGRTAARERAGVDRRRHRPPAAHGRQRTHDCRRHGTLGALLGVRVAPTGATVDGRGLHSSGVDCRRRAHRSRLLRRLRSSDVESAEPEPLGDAQGRDDVSRVRLGARRESRVARHGRRRRGGPRSHGLARGTRGASRARACQGAGGGTSFVRRGDGRPGAWDRLRPRRAAPDRRPARPVRPVRGTRVLPRLRRVAALRIRRVAARRAGRARGGVRPPAAAQHADGTPGP